MLNRPDWRAEMAVLRAAAGLHRHDALDLHLRAAPAHPHRMRERERLVQPVIGQAQAAENLAGVEPGAAAEDLAAGLVQDVVCHARLLVAGRAPVAGPGTLAALLGVPVPWLPRCSRVTSL